MCQACLSNTALHALQDKLEEMVDHFGATLVLHTLAAIAESKSEQYVPEHDEDAQELAADWHKAEKTLSRFANLFDRKHPAL